MPPIAPLSPRVPREQLLRARLGPRSAAPRGRHRVHGCTPLHYATHGDQQVGIESCCLVFFVVFALVPKLGPPVVPFYPFFGEGSPTKIDYRKKGTGYPYSNLSTG